LSETKTLEKLRRRIAALDGTGGAKDGNVVSLGLGAIDRALPWGGLPRAGVHEVLGRARDGAACGFVAALAGRLTETGGTVLWCRPDWRRRVGLPYAPGLRRFGLDPARLLFAELPDVGVALWALEEALRSGCLAAVVADGITPEATPARRLQLAAETGGTPALLLLPETTGQGTSVALTRWRVTAESDAAGETDPGVFRCRWRVALLRCRGGAPGVWLVDWDDEARCLCLVSVLGGGTRAAAATGGA